MSARKFIVHVLFFLAIPFGLAAHAEGTKNDCEARLGTEFVKALASEDFSTLSLIQVQNLAIAFDQMSGEEQSEIIALFKDKNVTTTIEKLRAGLATEEDYKLVEQFPGMSNFLIDMLELGAAMPGIFDSADAPNAIKKSLVFLMRNHANTRVQDQVLGQSRVQAASIRYSLIQTLTNTIKNARDDYGPNQHNGKGFERFMQRLNRYMFPHYQKVMGILEFGRNYLRQLERSVAVDKVILMGGLGAGNLNFSEEEEQALFNLMTNTKIHFKGIVQELKYIFGEEFDTSNSVAIHRANIYEISKRLKKVDLNHVIEAFDDANLGELFAFNTIVDKAMQRAYGRSRTPDDYLENEVQLLAGALLRKMVYLDANYFSITGEVSSESYTVKDVIYVPHVQKVGKTTVVTMKQVIVPRTVTPSFEDLLDKNLSTGSSSTPMEREYIIERTHKLRATENPHRNKADEIEDFASELENNYYAIVTKSDSKVKTMEQLLKYQTEIERELEFLSTYKDSSEEQILSVYENDSIDNFRRRNKKLYDRFRSLNRLLPVLHQALKRDYPALFMSFDDWKYFDSWAEELKDKRNKNYALKALKLLVIGSSTAGYNLSPEFEHQVDAMIDNVGATIHQLRMNLLGPKQ